MKQEKGFTLIELLVVIAILTVLPLVVVSDFPRIRLQFALSRVAHTFAQDLRNTQDMALSSTDFTDQFGVPQPISGYGIFVDMAAQDKQYIIYADAYPGNRQYDQLDFVVKTINLATDEPGVVIKDVVNTENQQASINFIPPNPDIDITQLTGLNRSVDVVFALETDAAVTKTVSINTAGLIELK